MVLAVIAGGLTKPVLADESTEHLFGNWTNISVNGHFGKDSPWLYTANLSLRATQTPRSSQMEGYLLSGIITQDAFGYRFD
ncbi:MAG: hypothetical protein RLZZ09_3125, partial [Pseudomonadota bacterium]